MMSKNFKYLLSALILLNSLFLCTNAMAVINCQSSKYYPPANNTITLAGEFYAGGELPVGSVIYKTRIDSQITGIYCNAAFNVPRYFSVTNEPAGPSFNDGSSSYKGEIYPTNVKGIGVALLYGNATFTKNSPLERTSLPYKSDKAQDFGIAGIFYMSLIKTGPIDTGSVVNGVSIPTVIMYAGTKAGYSGLPITTMTVNFSGSIRFMSQTCQTPDVNVSMGSYEVSEYFRKVGSTTPWIDSSIKLENCPTFTGYYNDANMQIIGGGSGTPSGDSSKSNIIQVSLQPLSDFIDNVNGVFAVSSASGGKEATGIGLQLGYTPDINASPTTPTKIWKNGVSWSVTPPNNGTANFRIPLAARYYQTSQVVTPGPADGKVVFTINYK